MSSIQLLVFGAALLAVVYSACETNWRSYGGHCYMFQLEIQNWVDARVMCRTHKSDLIVIETAEEQTWFRQQALTFNHTNIDDGFWLGATDWDMDKIWVWEPTGAQMVYKEWTLSPVAQPNNRNGSEHCLAGMKFGDYKWSDEFCNWVRLQYVCEMKDPGAPIVG